MKKIDFFVLLLFSFLLVLPIFLHLSSTFPRLDTDYDSSLPIYWYIVSFFWKFHHFPSSIPFVADGIPVLGDPLNSFFNPLLSVPLLFFGINVGLRISIFLTILSSGVTMFFLLKSVKVRQWVAFFGSLLYMSSGAFIAQIASGHEEKFLIYPLVPLLLLFALRSSFRLRDSVLTALTIAITVYSGDFYATWFFFLFFITIRFYYFVIGERGLKKVIFPVLVFPFSFLFGAFKLVPFLFQVLPHMQRYFPINPYQGSVHFFLLPLFFIVPFQVSFYDRPFFQRHLGFSFNWYEYYAFLSPFALLFLWKIKQVWRVRVVKILFLLIAIGSLYLSLGFFYSPFFWLFHMMHSLIPFRVPQRIVLPLTSVVVVLICICADSFLKGKSKKPMIVFTLFTLSIIWTTSIFWHTLLITFPKKLEMQPLFIKQFAKINSKKNPVVTFVPQTQLFLTEENIPIANYYYGWIPKGTETYIQGTSYDYVKLLNKKPEYVLTSSSTSLLPYGYTNVLKSATIAVWKRS